LVCVQANGNQTAPGKIQIATGFFTFGPAARIAQLCAMVALILAALPASAQTTSDGARESSERGRRAYNLGKWQESVEEFERAYQLSGDAALLFNLGQAHRQLGHRSESLRFYRAYLREMRDGPNREVAEKRIKELEGDKRHDPLDENAVSAPPPTSPLPETVSPPMKVMPAASPTNRVDDLPSAKTDEKSSTIEVTSPSRPLPRWLPIVGTAATVVLIAGAITSGLSGSSRYDELSKSCGQTAAGCSSSQIDGVKFRDHLATALWVVGGLVGSATGIAIYVNGREAGVSTALAF
jgi:hypothetical protein